MRAQINTQGLTISEGSGAGKVLADAGYTADMGKAQGWMNLSKALAGVGEVAVKAEQYQGDEARKRADDFVNSMTTQELNKMVQEGQLPAQEHPAFLAYVNNRHYRNRAMDDLNAVRTEIESGKVDFSGPDGQQNLDKYLQDRRKDALGTVGENQYAVAGYDSVWAQQREQLLSFNTKAVSSRIMEESDKAIRVSFETAYGSAPDSATRAKALLGEFRAGETAGLVPVSGPRRVAALEALAMTAAAKGDIEVLKELKGAMVSRPGEQGGQPLSAILGPDKFREIELTGRRMYLEEGRKAWEPKEGGYRLEAIDGRMDERKFKEETDKLVSSGIMSSDTQVAIISMNRNALSTRGDKLLKMEAKLEVERGLNNFNASVDQAILNAGAATGSSSVVDYRYTDENGEWKTLNRDKAIEARMAVLMPTLNPSNDPATEARIRARMDAPNTGWTQMIDQGVSAMDSLVDTNNGTFKGKMPEDTLKAYELWRTVNQTSPQYANARMGEGAKVFKQMYDLEQVGVTSPEAQARVVFAAKTREAMLTKEEKKKVEANLEDAIQGVWNDNNGFLGFFAGDIDSLGARNAKREVMEGAMLMYQGGYASSPKAAVELARKNIETNSVVTKNQLLLKSDLPAVPHPFDPRQTLEVNAELINRFSTAVTSQVRRIPNLESVEPDEVKLLPIRGTGGFSVAVNDVVVMMNGKPLTYNADSFRKWATADWTARRTTKAQQGTLKSGLMNLLK